ncbi:MAG: hypothetical protein EOP61_19665 [Sphingomonadales bacterium]|nr:MAG: hypothetical protein EOP61_19665 [Sphingomonadales bacterium]
MRTTCFSPWAAGASGASGAAGAAGARAGAGGAGGAGTSWLSETPVTASTLPLICSAAWVPEAVRPSAATLTAPMPTSPVTNRVGEFFPVLDSMRNLPLTSLIVCR